MNEVCTTIEQSQKLLSLGIDPKTADMYWEQIDQAFIPGVIFMEGLGYEYLSWSLPALMRLMTPPDDKSDEYYISTEDHTDYHTVTYMNCWIGSIHTEHSNKSPLDAAFKMTCWLKKNNKI